MAATKQRPDPQKSLVGFMVGDVRYAVPITSVKEIVAPLGLTVLPHAPHTVAGVADHRGEVIPVVDLRARFGLTNLPESKKSKWILVDVKGRTVGLAVDRVTEVFGTGGTQLKAVPVIAGEERRGVSGVTSHEGELVFVLEVDSFESMVTPVSEGDLLQAKRATS